MHVTFLERNHRFVAALALGGLSACVMGLLHFTERTSWAVIGWFALAFVCYGFVLRFRKGTSMWVFAAVSVGLRLALLTATPRLSDDYFRFAWDGRLVAEGINPYAFLPEEVNNNPDKLLIDPSGELFSGLNSKAYYSVYPPLNQLMFGAAAWLSRGDLQANILWLRIIIWLGEAMTVFFIVQLLRFWQKDESLWIVYALNPLVIAEITGNLHFEGWMVAFVMGAIYFFQKQKHTAAGLMLAGGALVKLLPLIFVPMLWARQTWRQRLWFSMAGVAAATVFFFPFISLEMLRKAGSSVDLYFRSFEFNASVYYLFRTVGAWLKGYNPIAVIGPMLGFLSLAMVLFFSFSKKFRATPLPRLAILILTGYFLLSTTVHPWYIVTLVALAAVAGVGWPLIWSYAVVLSYSHYFGWRFEENYWLIGLEYAILFSAMLHAYFGTRILGRVKA